MVELTKQRGHVKRLIKSGEIKEPLIDYLVNYAFDEEFVDADPIFKNLGEKVISQNRVSHITCAVPDFEHTVKILLPVNENIIIEDNLCGNSIEFATQDRMDDDGDSDFSVVRKHYSFSCSDKDYLQEFFRSNTNLLGSGRLLYKPEIRIVRQFERRTDPLPMIGEKQSSHFELNERQNSLHRQLQDRPDVLCHLEIPYFEGISLADLDSAIEKNSIASKRFGKKLREILDSLGEGIIGSDGNSTRLICKAHDALETEVSNLKSEYKRLNRNLFIDTSTVSVGTVALTIVGFITGEFTDSLKLITSGAVTGKFASLFTEYTKNRLKLKDNDFHFLLLISKMAH